MTPLGSMVMPEGSENDALWPWPSIVSLRPSPANVSTVTNRHAGMATKVVVTCCVAEVKVGWHVPVPLQPAPDQPPKGGVASGGAGGGGGAPQWAEHAGAQAMLPSAEVTVPPTSGLATVTCAVPVPLTPA